MLKPKSKKEWRGDTRIGGQVTRGWGRAGQWQRQKSRNGASRVGLVSLFLLVHPSNSDSAPCHTRINVFLLRFQEVFIAVSLLSAAPLCLPIPAISTLIVSQRLQMATRRFQVSRGEGWLGKIATISFEDFRTATLLESEMSPKRRERRERMLQSSKDTKCDLRLATCELWPTRQLALTEKQLDCSCQSKQNLARKGAGGRVRGAGGVAGWMTCVLGALGPRDDRPKRQQTNAAQFAARHNNTHCGLRLHLQLQQWQWLGGWRVAGGG